MEIGKIKLHIFTLISLVFISVQESIDYQTIYSEHCDWCVVVVKKKGKSRIVVNCCITQYTAESLTFLTNFIYNIT